MIRVALLQRAAGKNMAASDFFMAKEAAKGYNKRQRGLKQRRA
jgi:hypothetical protein